LPHDVLIVKAKGTSVRCWINWRLNRSSLRSQVTKEALFLTLCTAVLIQLCVSNSSFIKDVWQHARK